jgi:polyisoprenoid-binding protein YceI
VRPRTRLAIVSALLPAAAAASERTWTVDPAGSQVRIHVGKAGLAGFAGHEHEVVARAFSGTVIADGEDVSRSRIELSFDAAALEVTGEGEPAADVPKVQETMVGPKVLDVSRFPAIAFRSTRVSGRRVSPGVYELEVTGDLALHGSTRALSVPVRVEVTDSALTATGRAEVRQKDFGIRPVSAGGGLVKVKNALEVEFRFVARPASP